MRAPLRNRTTARQQASRIKSVPAPVKGWNARDPIAQMDPLYAPILDNIFPRSADVALRKGCASHVTGIADPVQSLMPYSSTALFAATDAGIYNVTAAGVVGASVATITNGAVISENFATGGTAYLYCVNGTDKPQLYNGAAWVAVDGVSVPAITGVTTTSLNYVALFKSRLWFVEKSTTKLWYLAAGAIGGAATAFDVGSYMRRGGSVVACAGWSLDGGTGIDDYFVIVTSEGELLVYQGTDPTSAATFALRGVYYVGAPLGSKCLTKFGGDLLYLNKTGAMPLSKLLQAEVIDRKLAVTSNIDNAFVAAASAYSSYYGWEATFFDGGPFLLVNIPYSTDGSYSVQYVMNTITGGWCRFTGWVAFCFAVFDGELYFGSDSAVCKAWTGTSDKGANITGIAQQAYNYLMGGSQAQKQITMLRPIMTVTDAISLGLGLDVDFETGGYLSITATASSGAGIWDTDDWDTAVWGADTVIQKNWRTVAAKPGLCFAFRMQIVTASVEVTWQSTDFLYRIGGVL